MSRAALLTSCLIARLAPGRASRLAPRFAALPACLVALVASLAIAAGAGAAVPAAPTVPWTPVPLPWGSSGAVYDVYGFGATSLAATGDDGRVAVTRDGGRSWKVVVPSGFSATVFTSIVLGGDGQGALASGGLLLVTGDGGATWRRAVYDGPGPGAATINDIGLRGARLIAVGDNGLIMSSTDSGATWRRMTSPTGSTLTSVAIAGDGTAVAGSRAGEILVEGADGWFVAGSASGAVTSVAAAADATWNDGRPDLVAASGSDVLGSDDALTFASLPGLPDPSSQPWAGVAWTGVPADSLLIAGGQRAGFFETQSHDWLAGLTGLGTARVAVASAAQSVAYLLGADGSLVRTLSAGREPATATLGNKRIKVGVKSRLTATVRIGAPGKLLLRSRVPGRGWVTERSVSWSSGDWTRRLVFSLKPTLTHEYSLSFQYGGAMVLLTQPVRLDVVPRVGTTRSSYVLRRGSVFRFSGVVKPTLKGERVYLYTDRGGRWRPVSLQRSVKLRNGRSWTSRSFGTPKRETYHLRARLKATKKHAAAWSRVVTVKIR